MTIRRDFLKFLGSSFLIYLSLPYKLLYSATKKIINPNLSEDQKKIMFNEDTERALTRDLLKEDREGFYHCANCGTNHNHIFLDGTTTTKKRFCNNRFCLFYISKN